MYCTIHEGLLKAIDGLLKSTYMLRVRLIYEANWLLHEYLLGELAMQEHIININLMS